MTAGYLRAMTLILFAAAIGAALVSMRQQGIEAARQITHTHRQLHRVRQSLWEVQTRAADQLRPAALEHRLRVAGLNLEPLSTPPAGAPRTAPAFAHRTPSRANR